MNTITVRLRQNISAIPFFSYIENKIVSKGRLMTCTHLEYRSLKCLSPFYQPAAPFILSTMRLAALTRSHINIHANEWTQSIKLWVGWT